MLTAWRGKNGSGSLRPRALLRLVLTIHRAKLDVSA